MSADIPDRGAIATEQRNPRTMTLHRAGVGECVQLLNAEDATVAAAVARAAPALVAFIERAEAQLAAGGRLIYIGAGTSGRLGVLDAAECPPTFQTPPELVVGLIAGGDASLRKSSESREDERQGAVDELQTLRLCERDTLLGIAAGGTTPYVLGALEHAHSLRCATGLLTCAPMEPPAFVDHLIVGEMLPDVEPSAQVRLPGAVRLRLTNQGLGRQQLHPASLGRGVDHRLARLQGVVPVPLPAALLHLGAGGHLGDFAGEFAYVTELRLAHGHRPPDL